MNFGDVIVLVIFVFGIAFIALRWRAERWGR